MAHYHTRGVYPALITLAALLVMTACSFPIYSSVDHEEFSVEFTLPVLGMPQQNDMAQRDSNARFVLPGTEAAAAALSGIGHDFAQAVTVELQERDGKLYGQAQFVQVPGDRDYRIHVTVLDAGGHKIHYAEQEFSLQAGTEKAISLQLIPHPDVIPDSHIIELSGSGEVFSGIQLTPNSFAVYKLIVDDPAGYDFSVFPAEATTAGDLDESLLAVQQTPEGEIFTDPAALGEAGFFWVWLYNQGSTALDLSFTLGEVSYTVSFDSTGGSEIAEQAVEHGKLIDQPDSPLRGVYSLTGWYSDPELTQQWDFSADPVSGDITLYAGWSAPLLIPDAANERIVLVDDMTGANRQIIDAAQLTDWDNTMSFYPTDVEIDAQGRMYVAVSTIKVDPEPLFSDTSDYSESRIIRIADAGSQTHEVLFARTEETEPQVEIDSTIHAISMDPAGENLYFADIKDSMTYMHHLSTTEDNVTSTDISNSGIYEPPRGIAFAESGTTDFLFISDGYSLYQFDVSNFGNIPPPTSTDFGSLGDGILAAEYLLFGDLAWVGGALQVIAEPDIASALDPTLLDPKLLSLDAAMALQSVVGSKGDPSSGEGLFQFPQRFVAAYKQEGICVTDGGGSETDLSGNKTPHAAHLIRLQYENDAVTEWEVYADTADPFQFEGYSLIPPN